VSNQISITVKGTVAEEPDKTGDGDGSGDEVDGSGDTGNTGTED
jgi:hypothetical protein